MRYFVSTSSDLYALGAHTAVGVVTGPCVDGLGSIRTGRVWISDNDAPSGNGYDEDAFLAHLERLAPYRTTCVFLVVPDIFQDGQTTRVMCEHFAPELAPLGFPLACILQDGAEQDDFPPCDAVFLAGSDPWRHAHGAALLARAKRDGLHARVGRVNSRRHLQGLSLAHANSTGGTYVGFRGVWRGLREVAGWLNASAQPPLITLDPRPERSAS